MVNNYIIICYIYLYYDSKKLAYTDVSFEVENIFIKPGEFPGTVSGISLMPVNSKWLCNFVPSEQLFAKWFSEFGKTFFEFKDLITQTSSRLLKFISRFFHKRAFLGFDI